MGATSTLTVTQAEAGRDLITGNVSGLVDMVAIGSGITQIKGDFIGRDKIIYQGPTYGRLNYHHDVADILTFYTNVFVGRNTEWQQVTAFTAQQKPGYMLIEAPPGYGKSALIAHLVDCQNNGQWQSDSTPILLYFFIRQERNYHTPVNFLQAVNSQLLQHLKLEGGVPPDLLSLHNQFSQLWTLALEQASAQKPLLLLVDGLDESTGGESTIAKELPTNLGNYTHVVVTSRPNPEPLEQVDLIHPFKAATQLALHKFSESEVRLLLQKYGASPDQAEALALRIHIITGGEPLFARFVCQEVAIDGEAHLNRLEVTPPKDVEEYFKQQFRLLNAQAEGDLTWDILGLLTVTLSGISPEEMAQILDVPLRRIRQVLNPILRFLIGDERYELMHLQLRKVVMAEFSVRERTAYLTRILDWCRRYQELNWPDNTPNYILVYYARHLANIGSNTLYQLMNKFWMERKLVRTGSYQAFAEDLSLTIRVAQDEIPVNLIQIVRLCLLYATLGRISTQVPTLLLKTLVSKRQLDLHMNDN